MAIHDEAAVHGAHAAGGFGHWFAGLPVWGKAALIGGLGLVVLLVFKSRGSSGTAASVQSAYPTSGTPQDTGAVSGWAGSSGGGPVGGTAGGTAQDTGGAPQISNPAQPSIVYVV